MKKVLVLAALISFSLSQAVNAQSGPKYGKDSLECLKNLSNMQEYYKINLYEQALDSWKYTFDNCPRSSKNIYIYGVRIYEYLIENVENEARKDGLVDTLMLIYDRRIKHFDQKGYVLGRKGIDLLKNDNSRIKEAYEILNESIELTQNESNENIMITYMMVSTNLFKSGEIDGEETMEDYTLVSDILEQQIKNARNPAKAKSAKSKVDEFFANSGAANCDNLIELYRPQFKKNPEDKELLVKVTDLLEKTGCEESEFFMETTIALHKLEPSVNSAYEIARMYMKKENYRKATDYLRETIELEEDPVSKATYYYQLGVITNNQFKEPKKAKELAEKAIELRPDWGDPYILVGNTYAATKDECGENDFQKSAVYWLVVDKFMKAKNVDPSVKQKANDLIERYRQYFPKKEDAFFYGFNEGDAYTVECWINETTRVRF